MVQVQNKEGINPWHEFLQAFGSRKTHSYSLINKSITSKNVFHYITSHSPHPAAATTCQHHTCGLNQGMVSRYQQFKRLHGQWLWILLITKFCCSRACATQVVVVLPAVGGHRVGGSVHQMLAKLGTQKTYN